MRLDQLDHASTALVGFWAHNKGHGVPAPSWLGRIFHTLLDKRATYRAYKRAVDDCLTILLSGFPDRSLPSVRDRVAVSSLVRRAQATGIDISDCSVQVVILLSRKMIGRLSKQERQALAQAFVRKNGSNPAYKGFNEMLQVVRCLNVSPALVSYLTTEVAGQLRGMTQEEIFNTWVGAQIDGVIDELRGRGSEGTKRTCFRQ